MLGIIRTWKKMRELKKLVDEAKKLEIIEPDTTTEQLIETLSETLRAKIQIGSVVPKKKRKKSDNDDEVKIVRTRTKDLDAYMAQQIDMMLNLFDKMFALYERMDRKMTDIARKYTTRVQTVKVEEKKETFEDKLIEKIIEQYLLGNLTSPTTIGTSSTKDMGGEVLKELFESGKRQELLEKLENVGEEKIEEVGE